MKFQTQNPDCDNARYVAQRYEDVKVLTGKVLRRAVNSQIGQPEDFCPPTRDTVDYYIRKIIDKALEIKNDDKYRTMFFPHDYNSTGYIPGITLKFTESGNKVYANWTPITAKMFGKNVDGYNIRYGTSVNSKGNVTKGKKEIIKVYNQKSMQLFTKDKNKKTTYYVQAQTYTSYNGKHYDSPWSTAKAYTVDYDTTAALPQTKLTKATLKSGSVTVNWDSVLGTIFGSNIRGYQIEYSKNSSMSSSTKKSIAGYKKKSFVIFKNQKSKVTYYMRIRTYTVYSGKTYYSAWSKKFRVILNKNAKGALTLSYKQL